MLAGFKRFWRKLLGTDRRRPERLDRVLAYMGRRLDQGVPLEEIVREEYVRRNASSNEVERLLSDPELVSGARKSMVDTFREPGPDRSSPPLR